MTKILVKKKQKFDALLDTAFHLFQKNGIEHTSISDITNYAGIAKGTFYLYFKDKNEIRNHLIEKVSKDILSNSIQKLNQQEINMDFQQRVLFVIDDILNQLYQHKALLIFIEKNLSAAVFQKVINENSQQEDSVLQLLRKEVCKEDIQYLQNESILFYMILEFVSSCSFSSILHNEPIPYQNLKTYLFPCIEQIINVFYKKG